MRLPIEYAKIIIIKRKKHRQEDTVFRPDSGHPINQPLRGYMVYMVLRYIVDQCKVYMSYFGDCMGQLAAHIGHLAVKMGHSGIH